MRTEDGQQSWPPDGGLIVKAQSRGCPETSEQHSKDSSSSAAVGVAIGIGESGLKFGVTASGSVSRGHADGTDTSFTTTQVNAGNSVTLNAGGDANLKGAVVTAPNVRGSVGGNLNIQSLQDTAKFDSKSESISASATNSVSVSGAIQSDGVLACIFGPVDTCSSVTVEGKPPCVC